MVRNKIGRRRFIITLTQGVIALGVNRLDSKNFTEIHGCNHSPDLEVISHPELLNVKELLKECCFRLHTSSHSFDIAMVRYIFKQPYFNAQTCRNSGQIWLGEALWHSFKEDDYVLKWVLMHEIGHTLLQQTEALNSIRPRNPKDLRFMNQFKYAPREELNCDRIAMRGMLRWGYRATHIRSAIIAMASILKSPATTNEESSHPGYRDRLLNVSSFLG